MELFNIKNGKSYYSGQLLMFDGIRDGENVYTSLSEVVLIKLSNNLYMNAQTKEEYIDDNNRIKEGDIFCRVTKPLVHLKNDKEVEQYILSSPLFFKDRIDIYMHLSLGKRKKLNIDERIVKDIEDTTTYHKIIKEQPQIVRAYAKIKK